MRNQGHIEIKIPPDQIRRMEQDLNMYAKEMAEELQGLVTRTTYRVSGAAQRNAPSVFGRLRGSIVPQVSKLRGIVTVNVDYAGAVEFGTRAHEIRPRKKKALSFVPGGGFAFWNKAGAVVVKRVMHPGTQAQPYLRPAAEQEAPGFAAAIAKMLGDITKRNTK